MRNENTSSTQADSAVVARTEAGTSLQGMLALRLEEVVLVVEFSSGTETGKKDVLRLMTDKRKQGQIKKNADEYVKRC